MKSCNQCGLCCIFLTLLVSPEDLERSRLRMVWRQSRECFPFVTAEQLLGEHVEGPVYTDIEIIAPMLSGRYRGTYRVEDRQTYSYGPCRHLRRDNTCGIHTNKPQMCQTYSYNEEGNPSIYKGCGYNDDPEEGASLADLEYMQAIWSNAAP